MRIQQKYQNRYAMSGKIKCGECGKSFREDTITLPTAEATMPGAVADTLKIRVPVP